MVKKILKTFMITLALIGISLAVLNFTPRLYAPTFWGTTTEINEGNIWNYYLEYGIEGLNDRHIEGDLYCVDQESTCCVHIEA